VAGNLSHFLLILAKEFFMAKNSRIEELEFLRSIMFDLRHSYPDHNEKILDDVLQNINYKLECEEKQVQHRALAH
jgi:hypothetical protein